MKKSLGIIIYSITVSLVFANFACADPIVITDDDIARYSAQSSSDRYESEPAISENTTMTPSVPSTRVNIPDKVKRTWKSVTLEVKDKDTGSVFTYEINIGDELDLPDSGIKVAVKTFLPSFVMQGPDITSSTNEPTNPAVNIVVSENGRLIFSGWLFQKFPTTHAFTHPRFSIGLTGESRY